MKFVHSIPLIFSFAFALSFARAEEAPTVGFRHVVCFEFKESATEEDIATVVDEFMALKGKIDTIVALEWGKTENIEPLNDDFTHCFLVSFKDKAGLETYLPHPDHKAFVAILKPHLEKVFVFDYTPKE